MTKYFQESDVAQFKKFKDSLLSVIQLYLIVFDCIHFTKVVIYVHNNNNNNINHIGHGHLIVRHVKMYAHVEHVKEKDKEILQNKEINQKPRD